ncbi:cytochrome P450 [Hygrophoropsis aurantiaca]|uniref:Cytochrome P450 n=1 Tax=Hygrophoropsis aurantiaca TaxID=72124 RepID=A0ACB8AMF4_9AGAM|nr:cytochrome P450 [Hygrophoropsis aurantiaca]
MPSSLAANSTVLALSLTGALVVYYVMVSKRRNGPPLPPGPSPTPIVGNIRGINASAPWLTYTKWAATYGDLVYSRLLNQEIIIINSEEVARDLLDRRSHIYSDRPVIVTNKLIGLEFNSIFLRYGPKWRLHRRLLHQAFKQDTALSFHPMQLRKTHQLLRGLLESPQEYEEHLRLHSGSVIMSAVYNYETVPQGDPLVAVIDEAIAIAIEQIRPGAAVILGAFPFILSLPSWFPGMSFKGRAATSRQNITKWLKEPFQYVQERMSSGTYAPSMVSDALESWKNQDESGEVTAAIREAAATAFMGQLSPPLPTASTVKVFVLAMVLYPDVQERAWLSIQSVIGDTRLPNFEDRASLPYIDAVLRETLRWHPIIPAGVPHATYAEDVYNGYYIPKGAMILPNVWAMTRNEAKYPNPEEFKPERFLDDNGALTDDTCSMAFGFGRRICVGRRLADASLWSSMALMLAAFKFSKQKDERGIDIDFEPQWGSGVATHPLPFPCKITPRHDGLDMGKLNDLIGASI